MTEPSLQEIYKQNAAILAHMERVVDIAERIERLEEFVQGNGHPGAKARLLLVEEAIRTLPKMILASVAAAIGVPLILGAIGWTATILVKASAAPIP